MVKIYHVTNLRDSKSKAGFNSVFGVVEAFACSKFNDSALSLWNGFIISSILLF